MKLVRSLAPMFTLVSALGISVWAAGCAEEEVPPATNENQTEIESSDPAAGSATGGGYTVPPAPSETDGEPATYTPAEETTEPPAPEATEPPAPEATEPPAPEASDAPAEKTDETDEKSE